MSQWFGQFPPWVSQSAASLAVFGASYVAGLVIRWLLRHRVMAWAARTRGQWDDIVVNELAPRIPLWTLLLGIYLAAGFWRLQPNIENAFTKTLFAVVVISLTLFAAAIVTRLSVQYSSTLQQALPVTSLTQNIAKGIVVTMGLLIVLERPRSVDHTHSDSPRRWRTGGSAGAPGHAGEPVRRHLHHDRQADPDRRLRAARHRPGRLRR